MASTDLATSMANFLTKHLLPSIHECHHRAAEIRKANPGATPVELAQRAVSTAKKWLAGAGAAAGMIANPVAMIPLAAGEMTLVLKQEALLTGVIAAIFDPDSLNDPEAFQADILAILFPSAASQALREAAVRAGQKTTKVLIRKYVSKDVLKAIIRFAAKYLGLKLTQKAIITKVIPVVGAMIGGTWNWVEVASVGKRAIAYHTDQAIV